MSLYRYFFSLLLVPMALIASGAARTMPANDQQLSDYLFRAKVHSLQTLHHLVTLPADQKSCQSMVRPWNQLSSELLVHFSLLNYLTQTPSSLQVQAGYAMKNLQSFFTKELVQNVDLYRSFVDYAAIRGDSFNPYERYVIFHLLQSGEWIKETLPAGEKEEIDLLKSAIAQGEMKPFIALQSAAFDKPYLEGSNIHKLTVLTLNCCFMPGDFPYLYGGVVAPWQQRLDPLAKKLLEIDADVVCLQEIHTEEASLALYERLKDRYSYFYGAIGPRPLGFSFDTAGLPSGLFVASKCPIEKPHFSLFKAAGVPMNFGFFDFVVKDSKAALAHIYTTHMQALDYPQCAQIRGLQLGQIIEKMEADLLAEKTQMPFFLCGDLNIPFGSGEPGEALLRKHFFDAYNKDREVVDGSCRTCTDYFTNYFLSADKNPLQIDSHFQILDYALLLRQLSSDPHRHLYQEDRVSTKLVPMNDLALPDAAITDHHGLLTTIKLWGSY